MTKINLKSLLSLSLLGNRLQNRHSQNLVSGLSLGNPSVEERAFHNHYATNFITMAPSTHVVLAK